MMGYNSANYDLVMVAHLLGSLIYFERIETLPWYIYKGWKQTNRFLDISDFNRRIALKRLEATMGMQIKESL
ncbi:MAG: Hypothetical protein AJITA_00925 [Acetilactobacillus jinshanensis]